ncbi:type II toxin-antitoxin system Phd/YefM family antitoxin [Xanthobacter autotrophicus]|uniref:hypothetical protein n=1 Tax=Xanthobacter autotrophicus TaxID=280 RepID=UPI00372BD513
MLRHAPKMQWGDTLKTMPDRQTKMHFGLVIDTAREEPVLIEKHGCGVVRCTSMEEYETLPLLTWEGGQGEKRTAGRLKVTIVQDELAPLVDVPA